MIVLDNLREKGVGIYETERRCDDIINSYDTDIIISCGRNMEIMISHKSHLFNGPVMFSIQYLWVLSSEDQDIKSHRESGYFV